MQIESFEISPLLSVVPAYLYQQYFDDPDLTAFINGYNQNSQGYLDWFNTTPLGVYTNENISGPLLDWIGEGVYGILRPAISTLSKKVYGTYNTVPYNTLAYNRQRIVNSGTAVLANDDLYKRTLTWHIYAGDGKQSSIQWLRRRVARFIYGNNGTDVPADYFSKISISQPSSALAGAYSTYAYNTQAYNSAKKRTSRASHALQITIPSGQISMQFQQIFEAGYLAVPFQIKFTVVTAS